jgi:hypothetical protein
MALKFPRPWPWSPLPEPPDPRSFAPASIMLASEGRRIPVTAVEFAVHLARKAEAPVHVLFCKSYIRETSANTIVTMFGQEA